MQQCQMVNIVHLDHGQADGRTLVVLINYTRRKHVHHKQGNECSHEVKQAVIHTRMISC